MDGWSCLGDSDVRSRVAEELADIQIYLIRFAHLSGIDLASAVDDKIDKNAEKYPVDKARGSDRKYDE